MTENYISNSLDGASDVGNCAEDVAIGPIVFLSRTLGFCWPRMSIRSRSTFTGRKGKAMGTFELVSVSGRVVRQDDRNIDARTQHLMAAEFDLSSVGLLESVVPVELVGCGALPPRAHLPD
jgi:hypothetical protein